MSRLKVKRTKTKVDKGKLRTVTERHRVTREISAR
jgi:hypothetical protein